LTGKYYDEPNNKCELCPKNTFTISGATDINGCEDCPAGGHSHPGSGFCEQCLTGTYYDEPKNLCELCPSGKFTATGGVGIGGCNTCEKGFYSSDFGASTCLTCDSGKYTNDDQTSCLLCPAGKISGVAASKCDVCDTGKYTEKEGSVECQFCNDEDVLKGSITKGNATASRSGCICDKGKYENHMTKTCEKVNEYAIKNNKPSLYLSLPLLF
jgi:hypothetical protein